MIAPPWVMLPPDGYGGIEAVVDAQLPELIRQGHKVEVFTVGDSQVPAEVVMHSHYPTGLYSHIHRPLNEVVGIITAHVLYALNAIREDSGFDVIHDNTGSIGHLMAFAHMHSDLPPVLHTFHGPITSEHDVFGVDAITQAIGWADQLFFNAISESQITTAPPELQRLLREKVVGVVPNPVPCDDFPLPDTKGDYFTMVARITPDKGQDDAVRYCRKLGVPLVLAGPVGDPAFFDHSVRPYIDGRNLTYIESVTGDEKRELLAGAVGFLSPHRWPEPFGMAPLEANANGTGVVAFALGALSVTVRHGISGFLAEAAHHQQFMHWMGEINQIEPLACRELVQREFSPQANVGRYIELYEDVIARSAT